METTYEFITTDPYYNYGDHTDTDILVFSYDDDRGDSIDVYEPEIRQDDDQTDYEKLVEHWSRFGR